MVTLTDILVVLSPVLVVFFVLANAGRIVRWWDDKHGS